MNRHRRRSNRRTFRLETLEERRVLAVPSPLVIDGTDGDDSIEIWADPGSRHEVRYRLNGVEFGPFRPLGPIQIFGFDGNDSIVIDRSVYLQTQVDPGPGLDVVLGGSGDDLFLLRDYERDLVHGGLGHDRALNDSEDEFSEIETLNPAPSQTSPLHVKVLVVNFDPLIPSEGNRRLYEVFGWSNPRNLAQEYIADLERASGGAVQFELVEWRDLNEIPAFTDGFRYSVEDYVQYRRDGSGFREGQADFPRMVEEQGIVPLVNSGKVDEVWFFGDHFFALPGESWMAGPGAFYINGPVYGEIPTLRPFANMGFSYERGVAEMLHNMGHRTEATMNRIFGGWNFDNPITNWDLFSANYDQFQGKAGVGTTHWPANAEGDYDTFNERIVASWADDFLNFPNLTGQLRPVNRDSWGKGPNPDYERSYQNWYFARFPRAEGIHADGKINNWWEYIYNFQGYTETGEGKPTQAAILNTDFFLGGANRHQIHVQYTGSNGVRTSSIDVDDIQVLDGSGNAIPTQWVSTQASGDRDPYVVVTYEFAAPLNQPSNNGLIYTVHLNPNEVLDGRGSPLPKQQLGILSFRDEAAAELTNDSSTALLLKFNGDFHGAAQEVPIHTESVGFTPARLGPGADFTQGGSIYYSVDDNLNASSGTIEFWIRPDWDSDGIDRVFVEAGNRFDNGMLLSIDGASNLRFIRWGDDPSTEQVERGFERGVAIPAADWTRGTWYHLAATWDDSANEMAFFLNGQLRERGNTVKMSEFGNDTLVIGSSFGGWDSSQSVMDEFRISDRARSDSEVSASYSAGVSFDAISVSEAIAPIVGRSEPLAARLISPEGVIHDVSSQVAWTSSNPTIAEITEDGTIRYLMPGIVDIHATLGQLHTTRRIQIAENFDPVVKSIEINFEELEFGSESQTVTVIFDWERQPGPWTYDFGDILIRGPRGFSVFPELLYWSYSVPQEYIAATYSFTPPSGYWDSSDHGKYYVDVLAFQLADENDRYMPLQREFAEFDIQGLSTSVTVDDVTANITDRVANQTVVAVMQAKDSLSGETVPALWRLGSGNISDVFGIHPDRGEVFVRDTSSINLASHRRYELQVIATQLNDPNTETTATLTINLRSHFFNAALPFDVDADRSVTPLDVLVVINYINSGAPIRPQATINPPPYLDPDNDGLVSPLDVLVVINFINSNQSRGGEGESSQEIRNHAILSVTLEWEDAMGMPELDERFWNRTNHPRRSTMTFR